MSAYLENIIRETAEKMTSAGIENAQLDVKILLCEVLNVDRSGLLFYDKPLSEEQKERFVDLLAQRLARKPVDKILGLKGFYKYDFKVNEYVLSPRPDTETLVEAAVEFVKLHEVRNILDLGTGSGCILLSILADFPELSGTGIDKSAAALEIARENAERLGVSDRVQWVEGSWFEESLPGKLGKRFDIVVTNPPYIPSGDIASLDPEVRRYDPLSALDGGDDGFKDYRRIAETAPQFLTEGGLIFIEAGIGQAAEIARLFCSYDFKLLQIVKDLGGLERCVILKK